MALARGSAPERGGRAGSAVRTRLRPTSRLDVRNLAGLLFSARKKVGRRPAERAGGAVRAFISDGRLFPLAATAGLDRGDGRLGDRLCPSVQVDVRGPCIVQRLVRCAVAVAAGLGEPRDEPPRAVELCLELLREYETVRLGCRAAKLRIDESVDRLACRAVEPGEGRKLQELARPRNLSAPVLEQAVVAEEGARLPPCRGST